MSRPHAIDCLIKLFALAKEYPDGFTKETIHAVGGTNDVNCTIRSSLMTVVLLHNLRLRLRSSFNSLNSSNRLPLPSLLVSKDFMPVTNNLPRNIMRAAVVILSTSFVSYVQPATADSSPLSDSAHHHNVSSLISVSQQASQDATEDGMEFLKEMSEAANNLNTYTFQSEQVVFKDKKSIQEKVNFFFKKPKLIRAEEVGDYKKGSVAVLLKNGSVRGHLGGLLSKINATVDARSDWVVGANGYPLVDSDFYSMSQVMVNFVKEGKKSLVTNAPVKVSGQPKPVYVLELYEDSSKKNLLKRAYIDPENLLPLEWFDYKDAKLFAHTVWRNLRLNTEINDSVFQL